MNVSARTTLKLWRDVVRSRHSRRNQLLKSQAVKGLKLRYPTGKRSINTMKLQIGTLGNHLLKITFFLR